jgi:hypothetical protein
MQEETQTCKNCGAVNEIGRSRCIQCSNPLTAYAGQLNEEPFEGKLAQQVAKLETTPIMVKVMAGFHVFFALFWPLAFAIGSLVTRPKVNEEGTNYLAASFGSIGTIFSVAFMVPAAILLCVVAWGTATQRAWGWQCSFVSLGAFAVLALMKFGTAGVLSFVWLVLAGVGIVFWLKADVKAWYGLD